jgi:hypothetical protein
MAFSEQFSRTRGCPLLDNSGQTWILARDGLSAFDPKRTSGPHDTTLYAACHVQEMF